VLRLKDLRRRCIGEKVTAWDGKVLGKLEGPRGGRASFAGHRGGVPHQRDHYSNLVPYVKDYLQVV
jgi:hypothetical protein